MPFNPGVGYSVYWKRLLLVLTGLTGTWIIDLLPRPKTGRKDLQRTYAKTTQALGDITSRLISRVKVGPAASASRSLSSPFTSEIGSQIMSINSKLRLSSVRILLAKLEPSLHREWNATHYLELQRLQFEILDLLGVIAVVSEQLDAPMRSKLIASPVFSPQQVMRSISHILILSHKFILLDVLQITLLLNLFYIASTSLDVQRAPSHQLPTFEQIRQVSDNLDIQLNALAGDDRARTFLITGGAWIELCKVSHELVQTFTPDPDRLNSLQCVEQLAKQCQIMFGTGMPPGA